VTVKIASIQGSRRLTFCSATHCEQPGQVRFSGAMELLRNYMLAKETTETTSYATHLVLHRWAHHSQYKRFATELSRLAVVAVGWAVPGRSTQDHSALQQRLPPHAQACPRQIVKQEAGFCGSAEGNNNEARSRCITSLGPSLCGPRKAGRGGADVRSGAEREGGGIRTYSYVDTGHGRQSGHPLIQRKKAGRGGADVRAGAASVR
jgi:hypothetical protein